MPALDDWAHVEAAYTLMQWLVRRNYAADDPRQLPLLRRLYQWHLDAYNKDTDIPLYLHAEAAERLYEQASAIIGTCTGDAKLVECYMDPNCGLGSSIPGLNSATPPQSNELSTP